MLLPSHTHLAHLIARLTKETEKAFPFHHHSSRSSSSSSSNNLIICSVAIVDIHFKVPLAMVLDADGRKEEEGKKQKEQKSQAREGSLSDDAMNGKLFPPFRRREVRQNP